jgi:hypothetical protein
MTLPVRDVQGPCDQLGLSRKACGLVEFEPEWSMELARADGLRLAGCQTLSAIIGNGAVNNGAAVDAFPCIKHEKEVREPLQHHHSLAFRTFH